jgi:hypothetical protein
VCESERAKWGKSTFYVGGHHSVSWVSDRTSSEDSPMRLSPEAGYTPHPLLFLDIGTPGSLVFGLQDSHQQSSGFSGLWPHTDLFPRF